MCYDEMNKQVELPRVDPTVQLLVSYADQYGRAEANSSNLNDKLRETTNKLALANKRADDFEYWMGHYKTEIAALLETVTKLERKIPKRVTKETPKQVARGKR